MDPEFLETPKRRLEDRPPKKLRKGMFILPSLFTTANIAAGYYAILQVTHGNFTDFWHFDNAAKAIGFAVLFDGLDGRIARMTKTSSDFGRELDSLADVITFGVAPAMLAWSWGFRQLPAVLAPQLLSKLGQLGAIASFLFLMAGTSRLARFNIESKIDPNSGKRFRGLPSPAAAGCLASLAIMRGSITEMHFKALAERWPALQPQQLSWCIEVSAMVGRRYRRRADPDPAAVA